ncbi:MULTISPECIES: hypothetical protein [unclassified Streptomyces]|uniref:hypothetical protein n=1 Tax=unclassified Streptomyces TaxID=2593676 RepID=UPI00081DAE6C|nr:MULTISPECIES: hypothetical protein [unclassified Streptomyces]SCF98747.1 hypothetical protein GA0115259_1064210 [Streptomyces sp. MnatMP-M17]
MPAFGGLYSDTIREFLGVPGDLKLLFGISFGISFGIANEAAVVNSVRMGRVPLEQSVVLHDTPGVL